MTSQMNTEVRWVRCPRCRQVLPELAEVPVYKCGGCDIVLQAKRKKDSQGTGARVHEADPTQKNDLENVSEDEKATILSTYESDLDKMSEKGESGVDCKREWLGGGNQSNESPCSDAISCHENASSSPEARAHMEAEEDKFPSEQCGREDRNESRDDGREHSGGTSVSNEMLSSSEFNHHEKESSVPGSQTYENESFLSSPRKVAESRYSSENNSDGGINESENCDLELPINTSFSEEVSSSDLCTSHEIEDPSQLAGVDENMKSHLIYRSPTSETFLDIMPKDQISAAQSPSSESVSADNLTSPCTESKKQAQNGIISGFQRVSSVDTLENMPHVYSRSDLGVTLGSSTAKNYYDACSTSCYETDDQVPKRHFHLLKRNFKDADSSSTKRLPKRDEFMVNHVMSSELELQELQHRPMNSSSILPGKKHPASKESKWHQDEFLEPTRYRHPVRSTMRRETNGYQSGLPFYSNGSQAGYRNGSLSSYGQNNLPEMPDNPPEADKLELLRMVYELQDQLNKMQILKGVPHRRFSVGVAKKEKQISSYNDHFAPEREKYPDPDCHRYPGRYSQDVTWFQQRNQVSRMAPLSGHTALHMHQVSCVCLRCRRQERYYSAQLPPHVVSCNKGHSMADPRQNYYRPYHSASSSPQHYYTPSEFSLWNRDTKLDDQMYNDHEVKKKHPTAKQHFLPIAGGAPIVACYHCSKMLQLPADFLLFKKRCHRLRCNACSRVLKFSLEMKRNSASASRASDCPHGEPVSCSDDYGQSFCRSCSTEGDHFPLISPFETANRISDRRKMSSSSSLESKKEGKKKKSIIVKEFPNKYKNHVKTFDAAGPSSEIEELSQSSGSQLHRLMGYASPSRLVYKYSDYSTDE